MTPQVAIPSDAARSGQGKALDGRMLVVAPISGFTYSDKRFPPRACALKAATAATAGTPACLKSGFVSMIFCVMFK